jgi:hypothetical protein
MEETGLRNSSAWCQAAPGTFVPIASSTVNRQLLQSAKRAVVMAGMNAGVQAGGGAAIYMGYLF